MLEDIQECMRAFIVQHGTALVAFEALRQQPQA